MSRKEHDRRSSAKEDEMLRREAEAQEHDREQADELLARYLPSGAGKRAPKAAKPAETQEHAKAEPRKAVRTEADRPMRGQGRTTGESRRAPSQAPKAAKPAETQERLKAEPRKAVRTDAGRPMRGQGRTTGESRRAPSFRSDRAPYPQRRTDSRKPMQTAVRPQRSENRPEPRGFTPQETAAMRFNCPVAAKCGGCQLGRLDYGEQLKRKQAQMEELLGELCPVEPIRGMTDPFHYRGKVHAVFAADKRGNPISGVYEQGTHHVVPVRGCLIEDRAADTVIRAIVELLPRFKLRIYNEYTHRGFLRHVVVRVGKATGQLLVVLVGSQLEFPGRREFVAALRQACPQITSLVLNLNDRQTSMVLGTKETVLFGEGFIEDELCGKRFRISPRSFYQVNPTQAEVLYRTAIDLAELTGQETILDAYCGTGTIGLCASDHCARLIGVELNPAAVKDAKENAKLNGVKNAAFLCEDAGKFMLRLAEEGQAPDVVFMDPPRAGSDKNFLNALLRLMPKKVVYVSCGPDTLKRDLLVLTAGGYRAVKAVPVDMFPNTEHVENVVLLTREAGC